MKTKLILFLALFLLSLTARGAPGVAISAYPNTSTLASNRLFLIANPGVDNRNISWGQISNQFLTSAELSNKISSVAGSAASFWNTNSTSGGITNPFGSWFKANSEYGQLVSTAILLSNQLAPTITFDNASMPSSQLGYVEVVSGGQPGVYVTTNFTVTQGIYSGDGSGLSALNASNLASGTVPPARITTLSNNVTFSTNAGGYPYFTLQSPRRQTGDVDFGALGYTASGGTTVRSNNVYRIGYNLNHSTAGEGSSELVFETHYGPNGAPPQFETYFEMSDTNGAVARPWSLVMNKADYTTARNFFWSKVDFLDVTAANNYLALLPLGSTSTSGGRATLFGEIYMKAYAGGPGYIRFYDNNNSKSAFIAVNDNLDFRQETTSGLSYSIKGFTNIVLTALGNLGLKGSVTSSNSFIAPTNYVAANFAPTAGHVKIVASNGVLWKVTELSTNLLSQDIP